MKYRFLLIFSLLTCFFLSSAQVTMQANLPKVIAPNSEFAFDVKINKGSVSNFAKYQIDVPEGITLSEVETKTGSFSFENNRGKIIWVAIPAEAEFSLIFRVSAEKVAGSGTFSQKFYFLDNGTKREVEAEPIVVTFGATGKAPAANNSFSSSTSVPAVTPGAASSLSSSIIQETIAVAEIPAPTSNTEKQPEKKESASESIEKLKEQFKQANEAKTPTLSSGELVYKIQIGAYGENPGKTKYRALPDAAIVKEGEFYKVLVGSFKNKDDALARKTELAEKGFKGFVVSYQNGQRIK